MEVVLSETYPTDEHKNATYATRDYFREQKGVEAVLLVNSCARGKAKRLWSGYTNWSTGRVSLERLMLKLSW